MTLQMPIKNPDIPVEVFRVWLQGITPVVPKIVNKTV